MSKKKSLQQRLAHARRIVESLARDRDAVLVARLIYVRAMAACVEAEYQPLLTELAEVIPDDPWLADRRPTPTRSARMLETWRKRCHE